MDPNPKNFPILSYVMAKIPSFKRTFSTAASAAAADSPDFDIENPPQSTPLGEQEPYFELTEKMPHLTNPKLISAMRLAVADVAQTRSVLHTLGVRPDHEAVDAARLKLSEIEADLSKSLEEIVLASQPADSVFRFFFFRSLVELNASFNKLTYLPTNIGYELVNLQKLSIHLNKLRSLPKSIGDMKSLRLLDVHFNELHGLPPTIGRLTNLEIINLSSNFSDLTELPDTIADLTSLKELDLSNNQIHALPDQFGRLQNLIKLNVDQNPLAIPPKEVVNEGVQAIKNYMTKRWVDMVMEEQRRNSLEAQEQPETSILTRSTSWLNSFVSNVTGTVSEYLGGASRQSNENSYLNQQL
ncbi:plant intracellular Ras-group-related LRR protein 1-like [Olea europaea var. sylvestris]|uniref:plant intracellular Ras-group-related LRR protein 1-like n=1 Tax=Olea europaea var. sylvestris TaxID=158386 RepID=UPI000C1D17B1|nr:plant intracellular Ras-group-related LRR protein 1-like [Olea europaea var. sylvestris]